MKLPKPLFHRKANPWMYASYLHLLANSTPAYFGSLNWRQFVGIFDNSNLHPEEHVLALQGSPHFADSVFYIEANNDRLDEIILDWCCARLGIRQ